MHQNTPDINQSLADRLNEIKIQLQSDILRIDLGCGAHKAKNFIGVDIYPDPGVDIVADLNQPFPFPDNSVDEVRAYDIIEHLPDKLHTMNEIWRVCKPGAKVDIRVPSTDGRGAFQDPTHVSFWNINSFFYYCIDFPSTLELCRKYGFKGAFKVKKLIHEESPDYIVHVRAELLVVKEQTDSGLDVSAKGEDTVAEFDAIFNSLAHSIEQYHENSSNLIAKENLQKYRQEIAEECLICPTDKLKGNYVGAWGKAHQLLLNSGLKTEQLTKEEQNFVDELTAYISKGFQQPKAINYLLAAMLYRSAHQLPLVQDLPRIPQWFLNDYLNFIFNYPIYFTEVGEADSYYRYIKKWIDYLYSYIFSKCDIDFGLDIADKFIQSYRGIPLYFNEKNLKDIIVKINEIYEYILKQYSQEIDYQFLARDSKRKKIRVGLLATHFTPAAETFASLPIYEYLSREFEVILYSFSKTGNSLEKYCQSCANSFKLLPNNLKEQVNYIRADDLDIIFIATNITAGASQICLLSMHRLARIQVTSVASVVTTGIRNIDYYISGKLTDPLQDAQSHYRENLLKLEGAAHCFSYGCEQNISQLKVEREMLGIAKDAVVFVSGANLYKIIPELTHTWARIIAAVPKSVLLLYPFGPNWSNDYPKQSFTRHLQKILAQHDVEPERLIILDPEPVPNRDDIKEYLKIADIYLDSYPFSGTTSLIEPLEVGLPIVTRKGSCFRAAMGAALLEEIAMSELVANSEESYIEIAVTLATNPGLHQLRSNQIQQKMQENPKFLDSRFYSAKIGELFPEILRKYLADHMSNNLRLRNINLIIFPDWNQAEESLGIELTRVIGRLASNPAKNYITLLVDTTGISEEDANLFLSSVAMNLLMEQDLDVTEELEISLVGKLEKIQWEALLPRLQARIILENENQEAIAQAKAETLPSYELDSFNEQETAEFFFT